MSNHSDDERATDLDIDELATRRARADIARLFAEHRIPGAMSGDLFCFEFSDLVGRIEILKSAEPTWVHAHMTVSGPKLAVPVLDCWAAHGKSGAEAITKAITQWAQGQYWAYHDAFAHDHEPSCVVERDSGAFHVFEAPLQWYGEADPEALANLGVTRSLLERVRLNAGSELRAHRIRWVHGLNNTGEVFFDDESRPELMDIVRAFAWPAKLAMARHSAVMLPVRLSQQRGPANISLGETYELISRATGVVDVDSTAVLRSSLQHAIEREPSDERIPDLCVRWSQLLAQPLQHSRLDNPRDAPLSRGLLEAYALMQRGDVGSATEWLSASLGRAAGLEAQRTAHIAALAKLYCETALPMRSDAVINAARQAQERGDALTGCGASSLEAPSAIASMRELWPALEVSFAEIGEPDPRKARASNAISLWSYKSARLWDRARGVLGIRAQPAVAPPTARTAAAVARVAEMPFFREAWRAECRKLATDVADVDQLLAAMVHTTPSSSRAPWEWRFQFMTASALALGYLHANEPSNVSNHPLVRLLDGPVDWSTTAAVIALGDLALREPQFVSAVTRELESRLLQPTTPVWHQCFAEPARWVLLRLM